MERGLNQKTWGQQSIRQKTKRVLSSTRIARACTLPATVTRMGGYDLFKSTDDGLEWEKPQNLGYPINTEKDEIGLMVTLMGSKPILLQQINKANGWDIYFFNLYEAVQPEEVVLVKGTLTKDMFASDDGQGGLKTVPPARPPPCK